MITRRHLLKQSALLAAFATSGPLHELFANTKNRIGIGACDWSVGKNSDPAAFEIAKQIGLEGIQINMGSVENKMHLRDKSIQQAYLDLSKKTGVNIGGLALGELNRIPYKSDPRTEEWVWDSIDVAEHLGVKVILVAFFEKNDLRNDEKGKKEVIQRLKKVAPKAERKGITLGLESYLSAEELTDILQGVGSKSIKVYYDFRNSADAGYDVIKEIKFLGKDSICELHIKENGSLLGAGSLDWKKIGETLLAMDYYGGGWMQIEGANPRGANLVESYKHNLKFIKNIFHYD
jgi:sugar phosphate isomerase/epimerase